MLADDNCIFCCRAIETTHHHILWDCPPSQDAWSESGGKLQKRISGGSSFCEMVENMMESLQREDMELFAMRIRKLKKKRGGPRGILSPSQRDCETSHGASSDVSSD